jgi:hypothetical protein
MKVDVTGRSCGIPVVVHEVIFDGEEMQCPQCMRRFTGGDLLLAHVVAEHRWLAKGENYGS